MSFSRGLVCAALAAACALVVRDADACGGCFHPKEEVGSSVITDHRMVFSISTKQTILWDQVRYSGAPTEFAWVLPVRSGAVIELSRDEWMTALDRTTRSTVKGPERFCSQPSYGGGSSTGSSSGSYTGSSSGSSSSSGGGGGCGSSTEDTAFEANSGGYDNAAVDASAPASPGFQGNEDVDVVSQDVIGPYQAVTIHSNTGSGIADWLSGNGFAIPDGVKPTVDSYTTAGFDFIALRLRPDVGVRAMRPVRVVTPGADPTMPLRMVTAGVGSHVGLTLWVVGEGRYEPANFPSRAIDASSIAWDPTTSRSNLSQLVTEAMAEKGGRTWVVEASTPADLTSSYDDRALREAYESQCRYLPPRKVPCDDKALPPPDAPPPDPAADAGDDAGDDAGAGAPDASSGDAGTCTKVVQGCDGFDDLDAAIDGLHQGDVWVTRLRADLPTSALDTDLRLQASANQLSVSPAHQTNQFTDPSYNPCTSAPQNTRPPSSYPPSSSGSGHTSGDGCTCRTSRIRTDLGTYVLMAATALALGRVLKRRRRF